MISFVTPAHNEEQNLPELYARLKAAMTGAALEWEWVVVDDHSQDGTFAVLRALAGADPRVKGLRLSRNVGAHAALLCGLRQARGECAIVLAADLQDPPELAGRLLEEWRKGARVVWAVRESRPGESLTTRGFARFYYGLMRHLVGLREMPATGADFFLVDRVVIDALGEFKERNVSLFALITWMGFRQASVGYVKEARKHGRSGWTLQKKLKLVADSVTSFSYVPIRFMSAIGILVALTGFVYTIVIVANKLLGRPQEGWTELMTTLLVLGGIQMLMMGVLGEYVWRALDEARGRPRYMIEEETNPKHSAAGKPAEEP